jgi:hypothetical protein
MSANTQQWAALDSQNERLVDVSRSLPISAAPASRPKSRHRRMASAATGGLALRARPARRRAADRET